MRDRKGLQHHPGRLRGRLELVKQARLAYPWFSHRGDDLPVSIFGLLGGVLERLDLTLAPDEFCQPAPRGALQPSPQRAESSDLEHLYGLADAFDPRRSQRFQREVAFD